MLRCNSSANLMVKHFALLEKNIREAIYLHYHL